MIRKTVTKQKYKANVFFMLLFVVLCAGSLAHGHVMAFSDVSLVDGGVRRATEATNERKQQRVISRLLPHA